MSIAVMNLAWYVVGVTPIQKAVLVALADHSDEDGRHVFPSVERLVIKTSYSERAIRRSLSDLRNMKLIHIAKYSTAHTPTEYYLDLPEMQARQYRPATDAPLDLPEMHPTPATDAPKPSVNHNINHNNTDDKSSALSDGQRQFLVCFDAKRFSKTIQRDTVLQLEQEYGKDKLIEFAKWAAKKGLSLGTAIGAAEKTLKKWGAPRVPANSGQIVTNEDGSYYV